MLNIDNINKKIDDYVKYGGGHTKNIRSLNITDCIKINNNTKDNDTNNSTYEFNENRFKGNSTIVKINKNAKSFDFDTSKLFNFPGYNQIKKLNKIHLDNKNKIKESSNLIKQLLTTGSAKRIIVPKV